MRGLHTNPASVIEAHVTYALATAMQEGETAIEKGNTALVEHYQMIAYLSRMILEAVDDVTTEIRAAAER